MVELATASLVVSGAVSVLVTIEAITSAPVDSMSPLLVGVFLALGVLTIATGLALRTAHWWLFGVNFVAVAAFLELTSGSAQGLLFGGVDLFVVVVLLVYRPWFAWTPEDEPAEDRQR